MGMQIHDEVCVPSKQEHVPLHYMFQSSLSSPKILVFHREIVSSWSSWQAPLMLVQKLIKKQNSLKNKSKKWDGHEQTHWVWNINFILSSNKVSAMSSARFHNTVATFQEPINKDTGMLIPPFSSGLNASHVPQSYKHQLWAKGSKPLCSVSSYTSHYLSLPTCPQSS